MKFLGLFAGIGGFRLGMEAFATILSRKNGKSFYLEKEVVVMKEKVLVDIINQIEEVE
ncbi:DNA cytosine methyltransferase [Streptococcus anginosus]|uniref:DNA cytosine methyltransferase n=1 Tax=Streptococcus anginosus TaxID=1328 RepID=UPI00115A5CDF|nr:DNA cytosine methyltransferase [Streptococcus anginosus]MCW0945106.1 DNA cytosine methyltransferase [Streptococcus anginosus]MCW1082739.1 DNA cytosine methyltransferase [Streptococcus anginosus]MDI7734865.1 DNA cytosine methyltransferase [Streptococcus anginosus]MED5921436.1 DNA cytosine methyltransferase [Streptococcus anginosus]MED5953598.1 DNA cytosine methyltransferase [Streptococcus anginosus]